MIGVLVAMLVGAGPSLPLGMSWEMTRDEVLAMEGVTVEVIDGETKLSVRLSPHYGDPYSVDVTDEGILSINRTWSCGDDAEACQRLYNRSLVRVGIEFGKPPAGVFVENWVELSLSEEDFVVSDSMPAQYFHYRTIDVIVFGGYSNLFNDYRVAEIYSPGEPNEFELIGMAAEWWRDVGAPKVREMEDAEE